MLARPAWSPTCMVWLPSPPKSLHLPSMSALAGFYHACLGFPVKQTWLDAIKTGNCDSFDGLTYSNTAQYCLDLEDTIMGHLAQQCQNICSTKPKCLATAPDLLIPAIAPQATDLPSNEVFVRIYPISKLYTDNKGGFSIKDRSGNQYVMIPYHTNGNLILQQAFDLQSYNESSMLMQAYCFQMNEVFTNCSKEDEIYPLTTEEIAEAQRADASLNHLLKQNAVIDQGLEIKLIENTSCVYKDGQLVIPKPLQVLAFKWYHHYLQHPEHTRLEETMNVVMYWKGRTTIQSITRSCRSC
jgi:hypothetical protein